jgi:lactoylglutathione lyase
VTDQGVLKVTVGPYCINVTDMARSLSFYTETIGLQIIRDVDYHGLREVQLGSKAGGGVIQLAHSREVAAPIDHGTALRKIYFYVEDCEKAHQRVVDAGWPSTHTPETLPDYPVTYAMVEDPDGYVVELIQLREK